MNLTISKDKCSAEMPSTQLDLPHLMIFTASKMLEGVMVIEFVNDNHNDNDNNNEKCFYFITI